MIVWMGDPNMRLVDNLFFISYLKKIHIFLLGASVMGHNEKSRPMSTFNMDRLFAYER